MHRQECRCHTSVVIRTFSHCVKRRVDDKLCTLVTIDNLRSASQRLSADREVKPPTHALYNPHQCCSPSPAHTNPPQTWASCFTRTRLNCTPSIFPSGRPTSFTPRPRHAL